MQMHLEPSSFIIRRPRWWWSRVDVQVVVMGVGLESDQGYPLSVTIPKKLLEIENFICRLVIKYTVRKNRCFSSKSSVRTRFGRCKISPNLSRTGLKVRFDPNVES